MTPLKNLQGFNIHQPVVERYRIGAMILIIGPESRAPSALCKKTTKPVPLRILHTLHSFRHETRKGSECGLSLYWFADLITQDAYPIFRWSEITVKTEYATNGFYLKLFRCTKMSYLYVIYEVKKICKMFLQE
jgi:hypothetical protein